MSNIFGGDQGRSAEFVRQKRRILPPDQAGEGADDGAAAARPPDQKR